MKREFTQAQLQLGEGGNFNGCRLRAIVENALGVTHNPYSDKRHTYIYSPPGAGKTFTVQTIADQHGIATLNVHGVSSINALVIKIVTASYLYPDAKIVVWVDDCDMIFLTDDGLALMKGVLDSERNILAYDKNLVSQISKFQASKNEADKVKALALLKYQTPGGVGVELDSSNLTFIITSNKNLCPPAKVDTFKGNKRRNMDEAAIRDRVIYEEFQLSPLESWGWIASVLMNNTILGLSVEQKTALLLWMYDNWVKLPATSMRAVKQYAAEMLHYPDDYLQRWNATVRG